METDNEMYFIRYPDQEIYGSREEISLIISAFDVCFMGAENLLSGQVPIGLMVVFLTDKLLKGVATPFDEWQLFNFCNELKLYPPKQLQKKFSDNFSDYVESCIRSYPFKLEELFGLTVKSIKEEWWRKRDNIIAKELVLLIDLFDKKEFKKPAYEILISKTQAAEDDIFNLQLKKDLDFPETYTQYKNIYNKYKHNWTNFFLQYPEYKPDFKQILDTYSSLELNRFKSSFLPHILPYIEKRNNLFVFGRE